MAVIDTLSLLFTANSEPLRKELDKAGKSVSSFKKRFGEESSFGLLGKTLRGGGAIAGLTLLGETAGKAAEWINKMEDEVQKTGKSMRRVFAEGTFGLSGLVKLWDSVTGATARAAAQAEMMANRQAATKALDDLRGAFGNARNSLADMTQEYERQTAVIRAQTDAEKKLLEQKFWFEDQFDRVSDAVKRADMQANEFRKTVTEIAKRNGDVLDLAFGTGFTDSITGRLTDILKESFGMAIKALNKNDLANRGAILGEVIGENITASVSQGLELAEQQIDAAQKRRDAMSRAKEGAIGGLLAGLDQSNQLNPRQARFAGLDPAGSGAQLLAMELSRQQLESPADKLPAVVEQIRQTVASIKVQLER